MNETPDKKKNPGLVSRLLPTSVAGKAAWATALVLLLMLLAVWLLRVFGPQRVAYSTTMTWPRLVVEFALVLIIPTVLYWGLRRWNQVIEGVFPDIDQAWESGIRALEAQGISVADLPIFLVLGSSRRDLEEGLVHALETKVSVNGIPNEPGIRHALQWYTSPDAIYLFCPGASALSALLGRWATPTRASSERRPPPVRPSAPSSAPLNAPVAATRPLKAAPALAEPAAAPQPPAKKPAPYLGTLLSDSIATPAAGQASPPAQPGPAPAASKPSAAFAKPSPVSSTPPRANPAPPKPQYFGTLSTDQLATPMPSNADPGTPPFGRPAKSTGGPAPALGDEQKLAVRAAPMRGTVEATAPAPAHVPAPAAPVATPRVAVGKLALPSSLDTSDQLARLRYVCKLLRRIRQPRCGINGILTLLPFDLSSVGPLYLSALAQSARGDVNTIQETLGIRAPLSAMLIGLEQDKGFNELVRRLQPELLSRRLGGRFDLRSRPTPEELNGHSDLLCDAFEDWVYRLFGRDDALAQQRGNRKLYELISRIRHELKPRLRIVLGEAFGCEPMANADHSKSDSSFFFSGCYFAASGASTGQPAFVKGVMQDKLIAEQSQVEWTATARRVHAYFRVAAILGWITAGMLAIAALMQWTRV